MSENLFLDEQAAIYHRQLGRDLKSLEIGTYCGQGAALLAQYGTVFCIDLWGNVLDCLSSPETIGEETFVPFIRNMRRMGLVRGAKDDRLFAITSTSAVLDHMPDMGFDLIYIDANHEYGAVSADIARSCRHLLPDGLLIFHDYKRADSGTCPGVDRAVDELIESSDFEMYARGTAHAILKRRCDDHN